MSSEMSVSFVPLSWGTCDMCVSWQTLKLTSPLRDETSEEFFPLSLSCSLPALGADRFVRLEGGAQPAPVVLANNGKDVMAFRDKPRYLAEDVSLT